MKVITFFLQGGKEVKSITGLSLGDGSSEKMSQFGQLGGANLEGSLPRLEIQKQLTLPSQSRFTFLDTAGLCGPEEFPAGQGSHYLRHM